MATCNDCIHGGVCAMRREPRCVLTDPPISENIEHECLGFHAKDRFVELPCKIGDKLYFNNQHIKYARVIAIYIDASGGMFDLKISTNVETVSGYESFINKDYTFEDIGQRIFLTREAAEQALKERETE